jgi:hypothetical protein
MYRASALSPPNGRYVQRKVYLQLIDAVYGKNKRVF